ncbi:hypothetical protein GCM10009554_74110 [Kribbella koreensis]|uniref:DUF4097 domain-containing protein n=1 Tax=Kribbella koreensis TaxID=57909 RepID=A0ABP4C601_9ACTN
MRRGYAAAVEGPIAIDLGLFTQAGWIKVQVQPDCTTALIGLSTPSDDGPSATAIRDATVESGTEGELICTLHGAKGEAPVEITVTAPPGSTLTARTDTAHIGALGLTEVDLKTASGNISVPSAGRVFAESASGNITIQQSAEATVTTHSGPITIHTAGRTTAHTTSGNIQLGTITGDLTTKSASGNLTLREFQGQKLRADTTTGNITVHATTNAVIHTATISGDITITATKTLNLKTTTATGRVTVP